VDNFNFVALEPLAALARESATAVEDAFCLAALDELSTTISAMRKAYVLPRKGAGGGALG